MSWSDRPDSEPCCAGPLGHVSSDEAVARLLHSKIAVPGQAAFTRRELTGEGDPEISNDCGHQSGCSVDRADGLEEDELRSRAVQQASLKPGRVAEGALIASAHELRSIIHEAAGQAILVYDDARADNERHAVIRVSSAIPRTDFGLIRSMIMKAFSTRITP